MRVEGLKCQEQAWRNPRARGMVARMADKDERAKRLAEELRKNLRKRKGQAREQNDEKASDTKA